MFTAVNLGDGRSLMTLAFNKRDVNVFPLYPYGMGVYGDQQGYRWMDGEHPMREYECIYHEVRGKVMMGFSFICIVLGFVAVAVHLTGASNGQAVFGQLGLVLQVLIFACFVINTSCAASIFDQNFTCDNLPAGVHERLQLRDHFDLHYGLALMVVGIVTSFMSIVVLIVTGALAGDAKSEEEPETEKEELAEKEAPEAEA